MKKRFNVKLVVWLAAGLVVTMVVVYGLHWMQVKRQAGALLALAETAQEEGDLDEARELFRRYLGYLPGDQDAKASLALILLELAQMPEVSPRQRHFAMQRAEEVLQNDPQNVEVRRDLAEFESRYGRYRDAREHARILLKDSTDDPMLLRLVGRSHLAMREFGDARRWLDEAKEADPTNVEIYQMYIALAQEELDDPSGAIKEIVAEMVEANPDSSTALLIQAHFAKQYGDGDAAAIVDIAVEKSPDDPAVLRAAGVHSLQAGEYDKARDYLRKGISLFPEDRSFYLYLAEVEQIAGDIPAAIKAVEKGLQPLRDDPELLVRLAEMQIASRDIDAAEETIDKLVELKKLATERIDILTSRVLIGRGEHAEARELLERVRPHLVRSQVQSRHVNMLLAVCYANLGLPEHQLRAAQRVLTLGPSQRDALLANRMIAAAYKAMGLGDEAKGALEQSARLGDAGSLIQLVTNRLQGILAQPEDQRNWESFESRLDQYETSFTDTTPREILAQFDAFRAEVLFQKGEEDAAIDMLKRKRDEYPDLSLFWVASARFEARRDDVDKAMELLDEAATHLPDDLRTIALTRVSVLQTAGGDDAPDKLKALLGETEGLTDEDRVSLMHGVAVALRSLDDPEGGSNVYREIIALSPEDTNAHLGLFEMAAISKDKDAMQGALDEMAEGVGRDSYAWHFVNGLYAINTARTNPERKQELIDTARTHVVEAERLRGGIAPVVGLRAALDDLEGNSEDAIEGYLRALERGATQASHFRRLMQLLSERGRWQEIRDLSDRMPALFEKTGMQHMPVVATGQLGDFKEALAESEKNYDSESIDYRDHLLHATMKAGNGEVEAANEALERAIKVAPTEPACWYALVNLLARTKQAEKAREVMARARQNLPEETLLLTLARCHEVLGENDVAERMYMQLLEERRDELVVVASTADFFNRTKKPELAKRYMERVLEIGDRDPETNWASMAAARRGIADITTRFGNYSDHLAALAMIDKNVRNGELGAEDTFLKGQVLARRKDGPSRREAIGYLEELLKMRSGHARARLILSQLAAQDQDLDRAREHLTKLCVDSPKNAAYKALLINVLLEDGAVTDAADWLQRLERQNPGAGETADAKARVLLKRGEVDGAIEALSAFAPASPVPENKLDLLRQVGAAINNLAPLVEEDEHRQRIHSAAERFFRQYADSKPGGELALAELLGRNGQLEEALAICQEAVASDLRIDIIAGIGVLAIRSARDSADKEDFELVEGWLNTAIENSPTSPDLLLQLASLQDMNENYDASEQTYRRVLGMSELPHLNRAHALNNLAFLLALRKKNQDEALEMIDEAMKLAGPLSDMLDTRAMVLLSSGSIESAIAELRKAVDDRPSGSKYFHLAHAYLLAENPTAAADALAKARENGLSNNEISPLERPMYRQLLNAVGERSARTDARGRGPATGRRAAG